jgi:hypothetical protein
VFLFRSKLTKYKFLFLFRWALPFLTRYNNHAWLAEAEVCGIGEAARLQWGSTAAGKTWSMGRGCGWAAGALLVDMCNIGETESWRWPAHARHGCPRRTRPSCDVADPGSCSLQHVRALQHARQLSSGVMPLPGAGAATGVRQRSAVEPSGRHGRQQLERAA